MASRMMARPETTALNASGLPRTKRTGQASTIHDHRFGQDDRDHDARPAADVAPQVLVDEAAYTMTPSRAPT